MLVELLRTLRNALPIVVGVAGQIFIAGIALLAMAGVPPMKAVTLPWRSGLPLWVVQAVLASWPLWALRRRLLPESWCVQLRCLPLTARALWVSDLAVSAAVLAPLAAFYAFSAIVLAFLRTAWWVHALPWPVLSLLGSWMTSCVLGAAALAWQRRSGDVRAKRVARARAPEELLASRPGLFAALLWWPAWRDVWTPGANSVGAGVALAIGLAVAWTQGAWPVVPGAAWAAMFSMLLIALTERVQRAVESHLAGFAPWAAALPLPAVWRWQARAAICAPMIAAGAAAVLLVVASRPWRAGPLAGFAAGMVLTPLLMTTVPSSNRERHVLLWAVCTGWLIAFGSELWN